MKKVLLSLAIIAALVTVSCKQVETTEPVTVSDTIVVDSIVIDSAAIKVDTVVVTPAK